MIFGSMVGVWLPSCQVNFVSECSVAAGACLDVCLERSFIQSFLPVTGIAVLMHDSNDFDAVSMTAKENTKGEGPQQTASDIAFHLGKQGRVDANARDTVFERGEKPLGVFQGQDTKLRACNLGA